MIYFLYALVVMIFGALYFFVYTKRGDKHVKYAFITLVSLSVAISYIIIYGGIKYSRYLEHKQNLEECKIFKEYNLIPSKKCEESLEKITRYKNSLWSKGLI